MNSKISNTAFCLLAAVMIVALSACDSLDRYAEKFKAVAIGDSSASVIEALGTPDSLTSIEVPLFKAEQLAWRSRANGRVYTIVTVVDRVAGKTVIQ